MTRLVVAAATLNQTPLDWRGNLENARGAVREARRRGVSLLCLPELCLTGYGCEDAFLFPDVRARALRSLAALLPDTAGLAVSVGLPLEHQGAVFNACALLADGVLLGFVCKQTLAGDGVHYEPRWFKPWPRGVRVIREALGARVPLGDFVVDLGGVRIGLEICEDAWTAERPGADMARAAVDVILNPSASHFAFGKHAVRRRLVEEGSRAFGAVYVYANLVGSEAGRVVYDGDALVAVAGEVVAEARRFSFAPWQIVTATADLARGRTRRAGLWSYRPEVAPPPGAVVEVPHAWPELVHPRETTPARVPDAWESSRHLREEELARALSLGLADFLRKSRSRGFVVSLSGGVDSATVAVLVRLLVRFGTEELGLEGMARHLGLESGVAASGEEALVFRLLTTAYQSTRNSSPATREAARAVAHAIGARHVELDVDELAEGYVQRTQSALGRTLTWESDDVALQNVQARARAPSVWMLANAENKLLLSTSNRSEAAVGYATMDGDTAGGLAPLSGIDKSFLRGFLRWLETQGPAELGPLPALALVNRQAPTAELRPPELKQCDEEDLMPYAVLDAVERAAIRDRASPREVLLRLLEERPEPVERLLSWVERFFRLFARNQWKRERYAPSFHVDDESLDPKTWCRFPILSGGFEEELAELRDEVAAGGAAFRR